MSKIIKVDEKRSHWLLVLGILVAIAVTVFIILRFNAQQRWDNRKALKNDTGKITLQFQDFIKPNFVLKA